MIKLQPMQSTCLVALICLVAFAAMASAQAPSVPYGESNAFALNTNRIGFGDFWVGILVSVPESDLPAATVLRGAVPNPFNPRTVISFTVARPGRVELAIYDLRGRCLRHLAAGNLDTGEHMRVWDGRTDVGDTVAGGVYLVRLSNGDAIHSQKITLVK